MSALWYALAESLVLLLAYGIVLWCSVVSTIKRWHDQDRSASWAWLGVIPIVGWVGQGIMCAWVSGTPGVNRYGTQPR